MNLAIDNDAPEVKRLFESLTGARLSGVTYAYPESWARTSMSDWDLVHEVDMDVVLHFADAAHLRISWAMAGLIEGLELSRNDLSLQTLSHVDVSSSPHWARLIGDEIRTSKRYGMPLTTGYPRAFGGRDSPLAPAPRSQSPWARYERESPTTSPMGYLSFLMNCRTSSSGR